MDAIVAILPMVYTPFKHVNLIEVLRVQYGIYIPDASISLDSARQIKHTEQCMRNEQRM